MNILFITNELSKNNGWATVGTELINKFKVYHNNVTVISKCGDVNNKAHDLIAGDNYHSFFTLAGDTVNILKKIKRASF
jgi:hypothetical protein